ncbi:MAG: beta-lactamase family protein [Gemmatimonadetes bacterium]|nr:beta-lactamase family protein [Gemmatimonadota bacterium]
MAAARGSMRCFVAGVVALTALACGDATGPSTRYRQAEANGIDTVLLEQAYARARETPGILSLLVQRNGVLVAEEYFHGSAADSLDQVWSVTKSMMSILTGIALDEGYLTSLDQTLADFLPPIVDSLPQDKGRITLRNLLTMTTGLEWHELDGGGQYNEWVNSGDMIQYVVDLPWVATPGMVFHYHTGGAHLLSVILTEATGTSTIDFARQHLFGPLGIQNVDWWTDDRGYYTGGMGLFLRPRDMVKIGELFLRQGVWEGVRIVPEAWVQESTSTQVSTDHAVPFGPEYGYLWWVGHGQGHDFYFANGYAGQFILVAPELHLVVVTTSSWRGLGSWNEAGARWSGVIDVVVNGVLPSVRS